MHCEDLLPLVEKLADGEATVAERAKAEAHLAECDACRQHLGFLNALPEAARRLPHTEPPGAYWEALPRKVMTRIERERAGKPFGGWIAGLLQLSRLRWLGAAAAGVLAVVIGLQVSTLREGAYQAAPPASGRITPPREKIPADEPPSVPSGPVERAVVSEALPDRAAPDPSEVEEEESSRIGALGVQQSPAVTVPPPPARARTFLPQDRPTQEGQSARFEATPVKKRVMELGVASQDVARAAGADRFEPPAERPEPKLAAARQAGEATVTEESERSAPPESRVPTSLEAAPPALMVTDEKPSRERLQTDREGRMDALESYRVLNRQYGLVSKEDASASRLEAECQDWRGFLEQYADSDEAVDARYRLAICSVRLYDLRQTDGDRQQALNDASSFLEVSPQGERAERIRRELARIR